MSNSNEAGVGPLERPVRPLVERMRACADEVMEFPHPTACDHLHVAHQVLREGADEVQQLASDNLTLFAEIKTLKGLLQEALRLVNEGKERAMDYEQMPDGRWRKKPSKEDEPQPVRCWYMRDNHTFRALPLDVEQALAVMRQERDAGDTYGMLCGSPDGGVLPPPVHAGAAADWPAFEEKARPWLEAAVAASLPPNASLSGGRQ